MPAPIDYGVQIADPTQAFLGAFQTGASIQEARLKQEQQQQQMANQKLIQEGFAKLRQPGATAADYANLSMMLPETQAKSVRESFSMLSGERQQNALQQSGQVFSAFKAGKPEIAIGYLERQIEAKRNSGDNEGAMFLETWRDVAKENPKATEDYFGFTISQMPGGDKVIESAVKFGGERRAEDLAPAALTEAMAKADKAVADATTAQATAKNAPEKAAADAAKAKADADKARIDALYAEGAAKDAIKKRAADLGLTTAQTNQALASTRKLNTEIQKAAVELEALKATGGRDPEKTFAQEEKIRKEWQGRSKMYSELQGTFNTLQASASSANGPGDIALITGFMKMLDPGSVVRETEFSTARDTAGLFTQLQNRLEKAQNGQLLSPRQRKEYVALSQKYLDSAQTKANQEKKDLGIVVKNYMLNPENVFGAERPATPPPAPLPASATVGGKTYPRPAAFTDAQWSDYLKANGVTQ
jgi:hypothetical protein